MSETIKKKNIKLVIFDALVRIHSLDENANSQMKNVTRVFQTLSFENGVNVLAIHHSGKDGKGSRGSQEVEASADSWLFLKNANNGIHEVTHRKARYSKPHDNFYFRLDVTHGLKLTYCKKEDRPKSKTNNNKVVEYLETNKGKWITRKDIRTACNIRESSMIKVCEHLQGRPDVQKKTDPEDKRKVLFMMPETKQ